MYFNHSRKLLMHLYMQIFVELSTWKDSSRCLLVVARDIREVKECLVICSCVFAFVSTGNTEELADNAKACLVHSCQFSLPSRQTMLSPLVQNAFSILCTGWTERESHFRIIIRMY